jgi:energy-coupling factor transporter transmembrane protein EcfT
MLIVPTAINIILMFAAKAPLKKTARSLLAMLPFILFASGVNWIIGDLNECIMMFTRLVLICNFTKIFSFIMSPMQLANAIETFFVALKRIFRPLKIDGRDAGLIVCIALAFIPILKRDYRDVCAALKAKAYN